MDKTEAGRQALGVAIAIVYSLWAVANAALIYSIESCYLGAVYLRYVSFLTPFFAGLLVLGLLARWRMPKWIIFLGGVIWIVAGGVAALYTMMQDKGVCLPELS